LPLLQESLAPLQFESTRHNQISVTILTRQFSVLSCL